MANNAAPWPGGDRERRKRSHLDLKEKTDVIRRIEAGEKKSAVARSLKLNESTIRTIYNNKAAILSCVKSFGSGEADTRSHVAPKAVIVMERLLEEYIRRQERNHMPVSAADLRTRAPRFFAAACKKYPPTKASQRNFKASTGWLASFIRRKKFKNVKFTGECASADKIQAERYPDILKEIIEEGGYTAEQVFNMDECGLQWKKMPTSTYMFKSTAQARGPKADKKKVTLLFCCNVTGSCKMKPLVIHPADRPYCYRHLKNMEQSGVYWKKERSAWMNTSIATDWFDDCFIPDTRRHCRQQGLPFKVLLLMDSAPSHPKYLSNRNKHVKVEFIPPNTTSLIQPMDQEVIANVKFFYQRRMCNQLLRSTDTNEELQQEETDEADEEEEGSDSESTTTTTFQEEVVSKEIVEVTKFWKLYNIRHAVNNMLAAWGEINTATINHSWRQIAPQLCSVKGAGVQTADESASDALSAVRDVPGCSAVMLDEVIELNKDVSDTSVATIVDAVEEQARNEQEREQQDEDREAWPPGEPSSQLISHILSNVDSLKELISESDPSLPRGNNVISKIVDAVSVYSRMYTDRINRRQQSHITRYFARQAAADQQEDIQLRVSPLRLTHAPSEDLSASLHSARARVIPPEVMESRPPSASPTTKAKRKILSLKEKLTIIEESEKGLKRFSIMEKYGIKKTTLHDILKNKDKVRAAFAKLEHGQEGEKIFRVRKLPHGGLDEAVFKWYRQQRSEGVPVRGVDLQQAAERLALHLGHVGFKYSEGWLWRFRKRHGIINKAKRFFGVRDKQQTDHEEHLQDISQPSEAFAVTSGCHQGSRENNGTSNPAEAPDTKEGIHSDGENDFLATQQPSQDNTVTTGNHHASEEILDNAESNEGGDAAITVDVVDVEWVKEELEGEELVDEDMIEYLQETDANWTTFKSITGSQMIENQHNNHHCPTLPAPFNSKSREEPKTEEEGQKQGKDSEEVFAEYMKVSLKGLSSKQRRVAKVRMLQVLMECEEADD